jgi:hypothetical protein
MRWLGGVGVSQATPQSRRGLWARLHALTGPKYQPTGRPGLRDQLWWPATTRRWVITTVVGLVLILFAL